MDIFGSLFVASLSVYLIYGSHSKTPSEIGFSINTAFSFSFMIFFLLAQVNELQSKCLGLVTVLSRLTMQLPVQGNRCDP
jgi:hypothetical protein